MERRSFRVTKTWGIESYGRSSLCALEIPPLSPVVNLSVSLARGCRSGLYQRWTKEGGDRKRPGSMSPHGSLTPPSHAIGGRPKTVGCQAFNASGTPSARQFAVGGDGPISRGKVGFL